MRLVYIVSIFMFAIHAHAANLSSRGTITVFKPFAIQATTSGSPIALATGKYSMSMVGDQPFGSSTPSAAIRLGQQSVSFVSFSNEQGFYNTASQGQSFNMFATEIRGDIRKLTVQFIDADGSLLAVYRGADQDFEYKVNTDAYNGRTRKIRRPKR